LKQASTAQLLAALTAEYAALRSFVAMLEREQRMLIENLTDKLLELSEQKSNAALALKGLAQSRRAILETSVPQLSVHSIHAWLAKQSPEGLAIWQKVLDLAKQSQQLNLTNGQLIHMKLRHSQQSLAVLSNAVNRANLYGPDGQPNFSPGTGRSLGSG
jgi:flagella synthesis protein FlgN